jgi:hypothetical protein
MNSGNGLIGVAADKNKGRMIPPCSYANQNPSQDLSRRRAGRTEKHVQWNWVAIFSYTASLALSLTIWTTVFGSWNTS